MVDQSPFEDNDNSIPAIPSAGVTVTPDGNTITQAKSNTQTAKKSVSFMSTDLSTFRNIAKSPRTAKTLKKVAITFGILYLIACIMFYLAIITWAG